jgi:glycosyltransferase involved in cell wall biosynthesis
MEQPLVSILINCYNHEEYIQAAIDSALQQTYPRLEVIVYDDGSTDRSKEIIRSYGDQLIFLDAAENHGAYWNRFNQINALNHCFAASRGEIVCLLDSDDTFFENKLEAIVPLFLSDPGIVMVQHPFQEIDPAGRPTGKNRPELFVPPQQDYLGFISKTHQLSGMFSATSGLTFRRSYLEKVFPVPEDQFGRIPIDIRLSRMAVLHGKVHTIQEPLGQYRTHPDNHSHINEQRAYKKALTKEHYAYYNLRAGQHGQPPVNYRMYKLKKWRRKLLGF